MSNLSPLLPPILCVATLSLAPGCASDPTTSAMESEGDVDTDSSPATGEATETDGDIDTDGGVDSSPGSSGAGDETSMSPAECGDGEVGEDEVCDDGINDGAYGGCAEDCRSVVGCGDGVLAESEETCDDGDAIEGNGCNNDCTPSGTISWSYVFSTPENDDATSPDVLPDGTVLAILSEPTRDHIRWLNGESGAVLETVNTIDGVWRVGAWDERGSYLVVSRTAAYEHVVALYDVRHLERWRKTFGAQAGEIDIERGERLSILSKFRTSPTDITPNRIARMLDAEGTVLWGKTDVDVLAITNYGPLVADGEGGAVVAAGGGVLQPPVLRRFSPTGDVTWEVELPFTLNNLARTYDGFVVGVSDQSVTQYELQDGAAGADVMFADVLEPSAFEYQARAVEVAPSGDIVVVGTASPEEPSSTLRFSSDLDVLGVSALWPEGPQQLEVTGLAIGPSGNNVVSARVWSDAEGQWDGWILEITP